MAVTEQTGWLIINRRLFLTVLEAGKSEIKAQMGSVSDKAYFLILRRLPHTWKGRGSFWGLFHKDTNAILEGSTLRTKSLPKGPPLNIIRLGAGFLIYGGHKRSVYWIMVSGRLSICIICNILDYKHQWSTKLKLLLQ